MKKRGIIFLILAIIIGAILFVYNTEISEKNKEYGVFLNANSEDINKLKNYDVLVIDGQNFTKQQIKILDKNNGKVISYLNVGSIETFRSYYKNYQDLALKVYDGWEDERWVNVSSPKWEQFIIRKAKELKAKGIQGFFIDNCDVYYHYHNNQIFNGLVNILKQLKKIDSTVIINGGDCFVKEYYKRDKDLSKIISGINQETVFSAIDFDHNKKLGKQSQENKKYYQNYIEKFGNKINIYMLEYTKDKRLTKDIENYANKHKFKVYIAKSANLDI